MVTITSSSLRANLYETIYDTLTAANLLSSTATVTAAFIDKDTASFPQVVINPVDVSKDSPTFNRAYWKSTIQVMIDIWTKKNKDKDVIADQIDAALSPLKINGVTLVGLTESNALEPIGGSKLHLKSMVYTYLRG